MKRDVTLSDITRSRTKTCKIGEKISPIEYVHISLINYSFHSHIEIRNMALTVESEPSEPLQVDPQGY